MRRRRPDGAGPRAEPPGSALPGQGPGGRATPNGALAIICVGICLAKLDLLIVNVALPDVARGFGRVSLGDMSRVLNGYIVADAALLIFGRLAERFRHNISFLRGVGLFTAASAACGSANGVTSLVMFRLVQAGGGADDPDIAGASACVVPAGASFRRGPDMDRRWRVRRHTRACAGARWLR